MAIALRLLERHHSQPRYREGMYKNWNQQAKQNWGAWSPQWPKKANKPQKKKEDTAKEQQGGGVLRAYDATPGGLPSSSSTTGGNAEQPEMQFFKEFVSFVKENNCELPENLKKMLPDENKESLREQQKKLNRQRNLLNKIQGKQKALDRDKEQWISWLASVKEEVQKQRVKHEESQKRLTKELEDLQAEEKRLNQTGEEEMMLEAEQDLEDFLVDLTQEKEEEGQNAKLKMMQRQMEEMYQNQLEEDRKRMQQHFSEQLVQFAAVNMDPYLMPEETVEGHGTSRVENKEWNGGPARSDKEPNCAISGSTCRQNSSREFTVWAKGEVRGTTERRQDDDEYLHGKSRYRSRAMIPGDPHFHVDDADGAVKHSRICQSGVWSSEMMGQILWTVVCSERFWFFILCVATDLIVFVAVILRIVIRSDAKGKHAVKVANHRFFFRRRMTEKRYSRSGVFMLVLICQQHMIQGSTMVGSNWNEASSLTSTTTQFPSGASGIEDPQDHSFLMTRPERTWDNGAMPLPGPRRTHHRSRERSEGGDFSNGHESDGDYYQMAFIFQLGLPPISRRLFWDDYWPMHRQIANACGVSIDELVGVHHIKHQPADLDELDVQSVIAQKDHEAFHGEGIVLALADIEQHSADVGDSIRTVREVRKIPKYTTRQGMLRVLGVESHCQTDPHPCIVWKNNRLWEQQSQLVKEIFHGDYIRCSIPPEADR